MRVAPPQPGPESTSGRADDDACLEAYRRELDYLFRTLRRLGAGTSDLEDLAHEVFLVFRRTWRDYDPARPLRPYLFGIAFRLVATHRRRHWRETPLAVVDAEDAAPRPDQLLQAKQARSLVLAALERIPLPRRAVLLMHDVDDIPMRDVAAELHIPRFTAYSRLRKARRELEVAVRSIQNGGATR